MLLRLGGLSVPYKSVIAVLDVKAASESGTAAFFRNAEKEGRVPRIPGGERRSAVLARDSGVDVVYYSSVNAGTLLRRVNDKKRHIRGNT